MTQALFSPARVRQKLRQELGDESLIKPSDGLRFNPHGHTTFAQAAVLIPLCEDRGQMRLLLTRRLPSMRQHSGELSFPGGKRDPQDPSLVHTALREAYEEVDLAPQAVEMFGAFASLYTPSGFTIEAFVGEFPWPYTLKRNPQEVDYLLMPALEALAAPGVHSTTELKHDGHTFPIHHFEVEGPQPLWGATGFMVYELLRFLGHAFP